MPPLVFTDSGTSDVSMQEGVLGQRLDLHKITGPGAEHLFGVKTKTMATLQNWPRGLSARVLPKEGKMV